MDKHKIALDYRKKGMTYAEIGKLMNLSRQRVHQIITGYTSYKYERKYKNCFSCNKLLGKNDGRKFCLSCLAYLQKHRCG